MMGEAMDMGDAVGEEADDVYSQILNEVGMEFDGTAVVNTGAIAGKQEEVKVEADAEVDDLDARLAAL